MTFKATTVIFLVRNAGWFTSHKTSCLFNDFVGVTIKVVITVVKEPVEVLVL